MLNVWSIPYGPAGSKDKLLINLQSDFFPGSRLAVRVCIYMYMYAKHVRRLQSLVRNPNGAVAVIGSISSLPE